MQPSRRVILVDPCSSSAEEGLARRFRAQGYVVEIATDGAQGAERALSSPPAAVVADLWMMGVSGVQLCRLLRSEAATADVPVILRGENDDPRSRFWAERAGAYAFVPKGRFGELVRVLSKATAQSNHLAHSFLHLGNVDIRDRIAAHLDAALFDSVLAAEVRALASAGSLERLFDMLSQFMSQVVGYRWLALAVDGPTRRLSLHNHPRGAERAAREARHALGAHGEIEIDRVEDADALDEDEGPPPIVRAIPFGGSTIGRLAVAPSAKTDGSPAIVSLVARELGGPLRMAKLLEDMDRLASTDGLTGLLNRRAFIGAIEGELAERDEPLALAVFDLDHFKTINDTRGHAVGDRVLTAVGSAVRQAVRDSDAAARWGGEEIVVAFALGDGESAAAAAERLRARIEQLRVLDDDGAAVAVTVSGGVAVRAPGESLDQLVSRADRAMYAAKTAGRNRVISASVPGEVERASRDASETPGSARVAAA